jgi:lambda family phage portal protein
LHDKIRPSQIREISRLARTAGRVKDVNEFVEAVSIKERILACLSIFIKKMLPGGGIGKFNNTIDTETELPEQIIAPGMINHLQPGDDVQIVNPAGQASNAKEFIAIQQRLAASGQGLSYEVASRDMSKSNYSSARQGLLEDQKTYKPEQKYIIETFCMEVYTSWLIWAVLAGEINIPDFWQNKKKYMRHKWYPPGWSWIDPLKEVKANQIALGSGQTTHAEICAGNGLDWKDVFRQLAKEQKLAKKIGLKLGEYNNANESEENESKESEESTSGGDNSN